ncbi:MAG: dihydrolipoyl dehydrogenase [Planctomycetes bacterium]|nr:dihydrolipoyl dehydrogenase [Planctomycetota bacterium]
METQVCVLGGGPGGYAAAFLAADKGMDVTVVDVEPRLGGTCLLRGCIPSKALLHATESITATRHLREWGIAFDPPTIDVDALRNRKDKVVDTLTGGLGQLARQRKVRVVNARGVFVDSQTLQLEDGDPSTYEESSRLTFEHGIIATGSSPAMPGLLDIGSERIWSSTEGLALPEIPQRLLVVGGGYIGLELGQIYARLGSAVTVVEMLPSILAGADADLVRPLKNRLGRLFADIHLATKVAGVDDTGGGVKVTLDGKASGEHEFDAVLVAVGRRPVSRGFGLENTGAEIDDQGFIEVDAQRRTADEALVAIGDVAGEPMLAHKASADAVVAVETLAGEQGEFDYRAIPAVVFTDPEIAYTGLTEADAREQGVDVAVSRYPWAASGRAQSIGRTDGLTKLLIDPETDRILGAGIVGHGAGELIAEATFAIEMGATAEDLGRTIHTHPTLSEATRFAAEAYYGIATEIYRPRKKEP